MLKRIVRRDEHVDITCRCVLNPSDVCNALGTQRFLWLRLIDLTICLDMQIVFYIRRESAHLAGVIVTVILHGIFCAVVPSYGNDGSRYHLRCVRSVQRLCARQIELVQLCRTDRTFNHEQVGILYGNICFIFFNTTRQ